MTEPKGSQPVWLPAAGGVTESYLHDSIAPILLGRDPHDHEAIFYELWNVDRHEAFFPVFLPGPVDVALWDMCAKAAGLPLYKYIGAYRTKLPVYASGISTPLCRNMSTKHFIIRAKGF